MNEIHILGPAARRRLFEHGQREVEPDHLRAFSAGCQRDVPGAGAKIKKPLSGSDFCQVNDLSFPVAMQPEGLNIIDQVVTPSDAREKFLNAPGSLLTWCVI